MPLKTVEEDAAKKREAADVKKQDRSAARQKKVEAKITYYRKAYESLKKKIEKYKAKYQKTPRDNSLAYEVKYLEEQLAEFPSNAVRGIRGIDSSISKADALAMLALDTAGLKARLLR
jgi:hypothetical protein